MFAELRREFDKYDVLLDQWGVQIENRGKNEEEVAEWNITKLKKFRLNDHLRQLKHMVEGDLRSNGKAMRKLDKELCIRNMKAEYESLRQNLQEKGMELPEKIKIGNIAWKEIYRLQEQQRRAEPLTNIKPAVSARVPKLPTIAAADQSKDQTRVRLSFAASPRKVSPKTTEIRAKDKLPQTSANPKL